MTSPFAAQPRPRTAEELDRRGGPRRLQSVGSEDRSARHMRTFGTLAFLVVVIALFGLATVNAIIVQQQRHVDELNAELTAASSVNDQLRVELTQLEAPERIVSVAKEQLGMISIEPSQVTYLTSPQGQLDPLYVVTVLDTITTAQSGTPAQSTQPAKSGTTAQSSESTE